MAQTPKNKPGTDVEAPEHQTDIEQAHDVADGVIVATARRAAELIEARGYGPATVKTIHYVAERALDTADLNRVIIEEMNRRFVDASTVDEILDPFGTIKGADYLGKPLEVLGVEFLESDIAEGFPYYVSMRVLDRQSGKTRVLTVGGEKLVMQAAALDAHNAWPQVLAIYEADRATKAGFFPLELRRPKS